MTRLRNISTAAATALVAAAAFLLLAPERPPAALGAVDTTPPTGSVSGLPSAASGTLELLLSASDTGSGLAGAEATLDTASVFVRLGRGSCPEHPAPGSEPPPGAECPASVSDVPLELDTRAVPDGSHRLVVRVTDAAGNTATLANRIVVVSNATPTSGTIATLQIGVASQSTGHHGGGHRPPPPPSPPPHHGRCPEPRLRMHLAAKPLWYTPHHVPVLRYRFPYPYRGRLTCLVSGRRVPAPNGTPVRVYYRIWKHSFWRHLGPARLVRKAPIRVAHRRLYVRLGFPSGRLLVFRYRNSAGEAAEARLRIAIAPRSLRGPLAHRRWRAPGRR